eukprot:GHVT01044558.1.p1 GENE.GHVT01044558.1~~GHVT01044558.1.p1  ORF type:complete len:296 (-),score=80.42 GHVT01044558.1:215-976(-)
MSPFSSLSPRSVWGVFGALLAASSLLVIPLDPSASSPAFPPAAFEDDPPGKKVQILGPLGRSVQRTTLQVLVQNEVIIHAWLYTPHQTTDKPPPVVLMGHGLGSQKDGGLESYAVAFANAGMAAISFDWPSWGNSGGIPRHELCVRSLEGAWRGLLLHLKSSRGLGGVVDFTRVALWGTSFGGGNAVSLAGAFGEAKRELNENSKNRLATHEEGSSLAAAEEVDQQIGTLVQCIVAQVPFLDGKQIKLQVITI